MTDRLAEARREVEGLPEGQVRDHTTSAMYGTGMVSRAAVLAILDRLAPEGPDDTGTDPVTGDEPPWIAEPDAATESRGR